MIIGIDISQIVYHTGVSRYTKELVRNLLRLDKKNSYKLFAGVWRQREAIDEYLQSLTSEGLSFQSYVKLFPPMLADRVWNSLHLFPIERFTGKVDVFHTSNWAQPPTKAVKVSTVHDITPILYPETHTKKVIQNFTRNVRLVRKECAVVLADSKATKQDLVTHCGFSEDTIKVIYLGVTSEFEPVTNNVSLRKVKDRYGITGEYLLSVGTQEPRKNLSKVVEAFTKLNPDMQLVLVGKKGWGSEERGVDSKKIIATGFVSDKDLPSLYSNATAFIYPSEYEGFGLPVLEAMACGCPVITSNVSSLPEVAGEAGICVNPHSKEEIMMAIKKVVSDNKIQKQMKEKSLKQAKQFSWEKTAQETLQVYQQAYE